MLTPIVRTSSLVGALPIWLQWYHAPGRRPHHLHAVSVGGIRLRRRCGRRVARGDDRDERAERRLHFVLGAFGAVLIAFGFYTAGAAVDLPRLVVLDQLADVVRDPRRDPDGRARR